MNSGNRGFIPKLAIVIPCYNEEEIIGMTLSKLSEHLGLIIKNNVVSNESFILLVDDGSKDNTWSLIKEWNKDNKHIKAIHLAANAGHQNALVAGMLSVKDECDCVVTIDADLQDDYTLIEKMISLYNEGNEVVCVLNGDRSSDNFFKRNSAILYYKTLRLLGINIIKNHADYRLLGSAVVNYLSFFKERNLFLRGLVKLLSSDIAYIHQKRFPREKGKEKYTVYKMLSLAWAGITSFSIAPLRVMLVIGLVTFTGCFFIGIWILWSKLMGETIPGWASTVLPIYFIGGIQLVATGLLGEYIGKIYVEVKARPLYLIDKKLQ